MRPLVCVVHASHCGTSTRKLSRFDSWPSYLGVVVFLGLVPLSYVRVFVNTFSCSLVFRLSPPSRFHLSLLLLLLLPIVWCLGGGACCVHTHSDPSGTKSWVWCV
jgi:hypothetical protein